MKIDTTGIDEGESSFRKLHWNQTIEIKIQSDTTNGIKMCLKATCCCVLFNVYSDIIFRDRVRSQGIKVIISINNISE